MPIFSPYADLLRNLLPQLQTELAAIAAAEMPIFAKLLAHWADFRALPLLEEEEMQLLLQQWKKSKDWSDEFEDLAPHLQAAHLHLGLLLAQVQPQFAQKLQLQGSGQGLSLWPMQLSFWAEQLLLYKRDGNAKALSASGQLLITYLEQPLQRLPIFRQKALADILDTFIGSEAKQTELLQLFGELGLSAQSPQNYPLLLAQLLFLPTIRELWDKQYYQIRADKTEDWEESQLIYHQEKERPLNQLYYGPSACGKTRAARLEALSICEGLPLAQIQQLSAKDIEDRLEEQREAGHLAILAFHPSMSYEDFMEGIKPKMQANQLTYVLEEGLFKRIAKAALAQPLKRFVLFIDELNRAAVGQVFGELLSLLSPENRLGGTEPLHIQLPYSKETFALPNNLYIIATMNEGDRSLHSLDWALRRRFHAISLRPQPQLLGQCQGIDLNQLLTSLNQRIRLHFSAAQELGHGYFLGIRQLEELQQCFEQQILPLLESYAYGQIELLGPVLGQGFIERRRLSYHLPFYGENREEERFSYHFKPFPLSIKAYENLYE
ncbi:AAA family ATPase [Saprospira sp. CCB-QB6]|uniref:McrB family protein n=1 Tax=Saprospira sp. CCB-QB6 TaxID=3023936 RepID=UPI00234B68D3|nr:AAA family ATPase [Saprospira sp. CCB-QB6]WCL82242.1 AAA family ATPase [Saprospira sp. CCB-QB6]